QLSAPQHVKFSSTMNRPPTQTTASHSRSTSRSSASSAFAPVARTRTKTLVSDFAAHSSGIEDTDQITPLMRRPYSSLSNRSRHPPSRPSSSLSTASAGSDGGGGRRVRPISMHEEQRPLGQQFGDGLSVKMRAGTAIKISPMTQARKKAQDATKRPMSIHGSM